jgi:hypothetical protein
MAISYAERRQLLAANLPEASEVRLELQGLSGRNILMTGLRYEHRHPAHLPQTPD